MLKWLRKGPSPYQAALAMIGPKSGDQILVLTSDDAGLAAEVAQVTGLNGRTLVVGPPSFEKPVSDAAGKAGTLIEFSADEAPGVAGATGTFDVVVWAGSLAGVEASERSARLRQLLDAARPGGRIVLIDRPASSALFGRGGASDANSDIVSALTAGGFVAARVLATTEGRTYYEARKRR